MTTWTQVCQINQLIPETGVCVLVAGKQIAIFYSKPLNQLFAVDNFDPIGKAHVLSRGIIGSQGKQIIVASPLYKQRYCLETGQCLDSPEVRINTYPIRLVQNTIELQV
ncbi:nitrite reductase small subunit NirD [Paraferrimonas sp. SM1919]|uniref:nitrite reductase small subunit NirD n=1 Tax=Paraferrimonas sp. SM1919 TaxID=2662263 RepID=UPI0013D74F8D|nr:nitrite reductase small subunit NirD [Paraferrimonas sp. SM1919]